MLSRPTYVPDNVLHALDVVDHELQDDVIDTETLITFVHLFGFDDEERWLRAHSDCCLEAMRRVRTHSVEESGVS